MSQSNTNLGAGVADLRPPSPSGSSEPTDTEKARSPEAPKIEAPDGGTIAWLVVLGAWCTSFCSFGWLNSVGVFQEYYQNELLDTYAPSTIAWIPSLQNFFAIGLGPVVGAIYDSYGPRWLLLIGSLLHVFGVMMASLGTEYYQILLSQGVCSAIGVCAIFQPSVTCVAGWFNHNRGAAFGILFTGSSIGGVIFPIMVSRLIRQVGFGWAMRVCAFLMLFLLTIANLTVKPFRKPVPQRVKLANFIKPLKELQFVILTIGFFLFSYGFFVPINYLPVQALSAGMKPKLVQYLLAFFNAGSLFGRLSSGFAGDRIGRYNIFIIVCFMTAIFVLGLWIPGTSDATIIAFAVLFGFFSGAYVALITPLVMQISPMEELGFRSGIMMFVVAIGGLTTNPINGAIVESGGGWVGLKVFAGVFCLAGTVFVLMARMRATEWKIVAKF